MILYKYTRADIAKTILEDCKIRFTQLTALNDPFESFPPVSALFSDELFGNLLHTIIDNDYLLSRVIGGTIDNMYSQVPDETRKLITQQQFADFVLREVTKELAKQNKPLRQFLHELGNAEKPRMIQTARSNMVTSVASELAVLSLSAIADNEVMWSHYADVHRGIVLGLESEDPFFSNAFAVKYQSQRPTVDMTKQATNDSERKEAIQIICGIKNEAWAYEQEYRVVWPVRMLDPTDRIDSLGFSIFVKPFSPSAVKMVVFGSQMKPDAQQDISKLLIEPRFQHVKTFSGLLDTNTYRVTIVPVK